MLRRNFVLGAAIGLAASAISFSAVSQEHDQQALIKAMGDAKVSLQQGLTSSQREGRPISAKFERGALYDVVRRWRWHDCSPRHSTRERLSVKHITF